MLQRTYDWAMARASHRNAFPILALVAFIESSVFPLPPDILIVPMVLAARNSAWRVAAVATIASVVGGFLGYGIGALLFESVGQPLLAFYGYAEDFASFQARYNEWGAWIVLMAGLTPFPYKVITIASGVTQLDPLIFGISSIAARGLRFYIECALLWWFGPPIRSFIEKRLPLLTALFFVILFGSFLVIRYLL